jgi:hypothetical protein
LVDINRRETNQTNDIPVARVRIDKWASIVPVLRLAANDETSWGNRHIKNLLIALKDYLI